VEVRDIVQETGSKTIPKKKKCKKAKYLIFCCPLLLLLSIFPKIGVFFNELALHIRWPKDYNFSISHPMNIQG